MFKILAQQPSQRELLQRQYKSNDETFLVSQDNVQPIIGLIRSITYEYFQNDLSILAQKITNLFQQTINRTYSLSLFRQIIYLTKKQADLLGFYNGYLNTMNQELAITSSSNNANFTIDHIDDENKLFQKTPSNNSTIIENVQSVQLKVNSKIQLTEKIHSKKYMESQLNFGVFGNMFENSLHKFSQFINKDDTFHQNKSNISIKTINNESLQLIDFERKGKSLMENNIQMLMREDIQTELKRQTKLNPVQAKYIQIEQFKYIRLIKNGLMNTKLKTKRKK